MPRTLSSEETFEPNEAHMIAEMIDILQRKMERDYARGGTLRDAHPKSLGVLRGSFEIEPDLPANLRVGLFKTVARYDCWLRASNSSATPQSDAVKDARGLAVKLLAPAQTEGTAEGAEASLGQDFVFMSSPVMPLGTVKLFRDAVYYLCERSPAWFLVKMLITGKASLLKAMNAVRSSPVSPLYIRYWSTTPYRFGTDRAVKYSLQPTSVQLISMPATRGPTYLSEAMEAHLKGDAASFDFCVQFQKEDMPIEDSAVRWDETLSPFIKLATLRMDPQTFRTPEREAMSEILSFSPSHAWPEHAPLGGINRARSSVYAALSKFRHERDARRNLA